MPEKIIFSDARCYAGAGFTCERSEKIVHLFTCGMILKNTRVLLGEK